MRDWKTSLVCLCGIAGGVLHALEAHEVDAEAMGEFTAGVGLILAKDSRAS